MFEKMIAKQFRKPSGFLGHIAANFMEKNNQDYYVRVVDMLEIGDNDRVLEIGCGAGQALRMLASRNAACVIDGIDFSLFMLKKARRNNREEVNAGRIRLLKGDIADYDFKGETYTKVFAINVVYFWNEIASVLQKLRAIVRPGGRLVMFMASPEKLNQSPHTINSVFNKYSLDYVKEQLGKAGFSKVSHQTVEKSGTPTYYIVAEKM